MALYLDSADLSQAQSAMAWGWVKGITTNPTLLARRSEPPSQILQELKDLCNGEIYYQLMSTTVEEMLREGEAAFTILGQQTVLKIPATSTGFQALPRLSPQMACSVTGIYSPAQAAVAAEGGAKYAIAYVNRATRLQGDGVGLVQAMAQVLANCETKILAASIKSPAEAVAALGAGALHLTLPYDMLQQMTQHPLSDQTVQDFNRGGRGLFSD
ncbi:MAG: transaldolase family protein [Cyanobacteria bacterium P01_F01_bin.42]